MHPSVLRKRGTPAVLVTSLPAGYLRTVAAPTKALLRALCSTGKGKRFVLFPLFVELCSDLLCLSFKKMSGRR